MFSSHFNNNTHTQKNPLTLFFNHKAGWINVISAELFLTFVKKRRNAHEDVACALWTVPVCSSRWQTHTTPLSHMHAHTVALARHVCRGVVPSSSPTESRRRWETPGSSGIIPTRGLLCNTCSSVVGGEKLICHHENFQNPSLIISNRSAWCSVVFAQPCLLKAQD